MKDDTLEIVYLSTDELCAINKAFRNNKSLQQTFLDRSSAIIKLIASKGVDPERFLNKNNHFMIYKINDDKWYVKEGGN